jgi:hypothetical protein
VNSGISGKLLQLDKGSIFAMGENMFYKVRQFHIDFSCLVLWENKPLGGDHDD